MTTHQAISGSTDEEFLERMVSSHEQRFSPLFWDFFTSHVEALVPEQPVIVDLGCGPGLLLRDLGERFPKATLYGYDVTPAMVEYAQGASYPGARPSVAVHDVANQPLPLAAGSVHLVTMTAVLHVLDDPLEALAEVRRLLAPDGAFLLYDWVRTSLQTYLESGPGVPDDSPAALKRQFRMFPFHNKYTPEDWTWLLENTGFTVKSTAQPRPAFRAFLATPASQPRLVSRMKTR